VCVENGVFEGIAGKVVFRRRFLGEGTGEGNYLINKGVGPVPVIGFPRTPTPFEIDIKH
jgi:hypothetical protein